MKIVNRIRVWLNRGRGGAGEVTLTTPAGQGGQGVSPEFVGIITDNGEVIEIQDKGGRVDE